MSEAHRLLRLIRVELKVMCKDCSKSFLQVVDPVTRKELGVNQGGELLFSGPGVRWLWFRLIEQLQVTYSLFSLPRKFYSMYTKNI